MYVAVYSWVCHSIVTRFVRFVRSGVLGLVPRCMNQSDWGVFVQVHWVFPGWVIVVVDGRVGIGGGDVY